MWASQAPLPAPKKWVDDSFFSFLPRGQKWARANWRPRRPFAACPKGGAGGRKEELYEHVRVVALLACLSAQFTLCFIDRDSGVIFLLTRALAAEGLDRRKTTQGLGRPEPDKLSIFLPEKCVLELELRAILTTFSFRRRRRRQSSIFGGRD